MFNLEIFLDWYGTNVEWTVRWNLKSALTLCLASSCFWVLSPNSIPVTTRHFEVWIPPGNWAFWPICQAPINVQRLLPQLKKPNMDPHAGWRCKDFECESKILVTHCISQTAFQKILDWIVAKVPTILQWKWQTLMDQVSWMKQCSRLGPQHEVVIRLLILLSNNNWREVSKTNFLQNPTENWALAGKQVIFLILFWERPIASKSCTRFQWLSLYLCGSKWLTLPNWGNIGNILAERGKKKKKYIYLHTCKITCIYTVHISYYHDFLAKRDKLIYWATSKSSNFWLNLIMNTSCWNLGFL